MTYRSWFRSIALAAAATVVASGALGAPAAAAAASGVTVEGRGYGHGRGMSQWGAYGAAASGLTWAQILEFYYPGTQRSGQGDPMTRVLISGDSDGTTELEPSVGLYTRTAGASHVLPAADFITSWRVVRSATELRVQYRDAAGTWRPYAYPGTVGADITFGNRSGLLRLVRPDGTRQELRHAVRAVLDGSTVRSVAVMPTEQYLRSVVPAEMPSSWNISALMAQAVAARTYAARLRTSPSSVLWDTCDTVACQVFRGTARYTATGELISAGENARTDKAISATAGVVLTFTDSAGRTVPALTEFSASNGGHTVAGSSAHPYLVARPDPYDGLVGNPVHAWTEVVPAATVEAVYPSIGDFRRIRVLSRDGKGAWGGRVESASVEGSAGSVVVTGAALRTALRLRSSWLLVPDPSYPRDWNEDTAADVVASDSAGGLWLYPGNGAGGFGRRQQVGHGWGAMDAVLFAGDFDGDARHDLLARRSSDRTLWLYSGDGAGGFTGARQAGRGWGGIAELLSPGDWDGDGRPDVLARHAGTGALWLYSGSGSGGFASSRQIGVGWSAFDQLTGPGDWDGDGRADLLARHVATGELRLYPGDGTGGFGRPRTVGWRWGALDRVLGPGDWDGDGSPDLLARVRSTGELRVYLGDGRGGFVGSRSVGVGWSGMRPVT